jgi:hypothetical protein
VGVGGASTGEAGSAKFSASHPASGLSGGWFVFSVHASEPELELIQTQISQKPMLRKKSLRACVAREAKR